MSSYSIELVVTDDSASVLSAIRECALTDVEVETYREVTTATVLLTAAAAVKLFTALVELRDKLKARKDPPKLQAKRGDGAALDLLKATDEALKQFSELAK